MPVEGVGMIATSRHTNSPRRRSLKKSQTMRWSSLVSVVNGAWCKLEKSTGIVLHDLSFNLVLHTSVTTA